MRIIQAPGLEMHEIDSSTYDSTQDNSIVGTTAFLMGFADKGDDYTTKYVNSMNSFIQNYGYPTNEAERYFYNAAYEVLNRGGNLYTSKLPYDNESLRKYSFCSYTVDNNERQLSSPYDITTTDIGILPDVSLYEFLLMPNINLSSESTNQINVIKYLDDCGINLPIITRLFEFLKEKCNFSYSTEVVMLKYFYNTDGKTCKNCAVYMLKDMSQDLQGFKNSYNIEESDYPEIDSMYNSLLIVGDDFDKWITKFGKSLTLQEFRYYYEKLITDVEEVGDKGGTEIQESLLEILDSFKTTELYETKYTGLKQIDDTLTSYVRINSNPQTSKYSGMITMENLDKFRTDQTKVPENQIYIVDTTRQKYQKDWSEISKGKEYIGILPVITTAANALYYQKYIENNLSTEKEYNSISCIQNKYTTDIAHTEEYGDIGLSSILSNLNNDDIDIKKIVGFTQNFGQEKSVTEDQVTVSKTTASYFPAITLRNGILNSDNLKKIGIVVFKMFIDDSSDGMIGLTPVESFSGTLNRKDIDINTGVSTFIDRIVNTNSRYINCFSNVKFSQNINVRKYATDTCSIFMVNNQVGTSLGFYEKDCEKDISIKESIYNAIELIFDNNKDYNTFDIDFIIDAGVSNIAQFIKSVHKKEKGKFDFDIDTSYLFRLESSDQASVWAYVIKKYDNFCKNVRKDCMFIADGMRPLCLLGEEKLVRSTKPENTVENQILQKIKYISGIINSSYGAGYCNWFRAIDYSSKQYYWCPPSIKAAGAYVYTDAYSHYWMAPAGLRRGKVLEDVIDVAFNPTNDEAGKIYLNNWNYAISYPINGIVIEGQKTFQKDKTAFDRVNVRRLFLGLEKDVRYLAKFFTYEGITDYLMQRFVDTMTPVFEEAKTNDGILDYIIVCDSRNNNTQTIENNELHCTIAVKPVKSLEYIVMNFIATSQGASVTEVASENL